MIKKLIATTAMSLTSFVAVAADLPKRSNAPVPAPAFVNAPLSWAGFYAGVSVGYVGTKNTIYVVDGDPTYFPDFAGGETMKHKAHSLFGGGEAGFNVQTGNFVYGVFVSASGMNGSDKTWSNGACCGTGDDMFTSKLKSVNVIGGRVGYAFDRALVYVDGGFALAYHQLDLIDANVREDGSTSSSSVGSKLVNKWLPGYSIGAGVEYAITNNWRLGLNYRYVNFGTTDWNMTTSSYSSNGEYRGEATYLLKTKGLDAHMIGVSAKYYFGGTSAPVVARY